MDTQLFNRIDQDTPRFNPQIAGGLARKQLESVEGYVDRVMRCMAASLPPEMKYVGPGRCSPVEEYNTATMRRNTTQQFELARCDMYLNKYQFELRGEPLKIAHLYLPFVNEAGLIHMMGSQFSVSPVIADHAISVGKDQLFIPLNRDKLTFMRFLYHFRVDGRREPAYVVWAQIYHPPTIRTPGKSRKTSMARTSNLHYLLCKYGFTKTFADMAGVEAHCGYADTINGETYPPDEWIICESAHVKPRGVNARMYRPSQIRVAIRRVQTDYLTVTSMLAGFFYIVDHFPERIRPDDIEDTALWRILLGHVYFSNSETEGKLLNKFNAHMASLDGYVDGMVREWMREDGIHVEDIYELLMYLIQTYPYRIANSSRQISSMYWKRLTILRYLLIDIIKAIFEMLFAIQKAAQTPKGLTKKDVESIMTRKLKPRMIVHINQPHAEVASVSSPTDNMIFKITCNIVLQSKARGGPAAKSKSTPFDKTRILDSSIAEVGSFQHLPKTQPTGHNRINPCLPLGPDGAIEPNPKHAELLAAVQREIER
jgi:hypothetical protein